MIAGASLLLLVSLTITFLTNINFRRFRNICFFMVDCVRPSAPGVALCFLCTAPLPIKKQVPNCPKPVF